MTSPSDPVLRAARREATFTFVVFVLALAYTVGYCSQYAYGRTLDSLTFVWGFPDWVFWGIVVPWAVVLAITILFCLTVMGDESLGQEVDETHASPGSHEDHAG